MKFPGTCIVCQEKINVNEIGLWAKGIGVKHERCSQTKELTCIVCGNPAGCPSCEFAEDCNLESVSQFCICKGCSEKKEPLTLYKKAAAKEFRLLNS